jgi:ribosomal protein S18 acetylase RimI-like enzyme/muconolactone delta-isomerase
VSLPNNPASSADGIRPINLRTDLAPLADLIEVVFADSMDSSGLAAVREMRSLSKMSAGINMLAGINDLAQGISLGFVCIADGKLVGNVSISPAAWAETPGKTWIITNVGVHPDYQRRGIAAQLMYACMDLIRERGGETALLQVDMHNDTARRLYRRLGFVEERAWILWRRPGSIRIPPPLENRSAYITRQRRGEWRAEYELAQRLRPAHLGGIGWQRPLRLSLFRKSLLRRVVDWVNFRSEERLVIRSLDEQHILASLWVESMFLSGSTQLTLLVDPDYLGRYDETLINLAVRTYATNRGTLLLEHPADETITSDILRDYHFRPQREVMHMRWDVNK